MTGFEKFDSVHELEKDGSSVADSQARVFFDGDDLNCCSYSSNMCDCLVALLDCGMMMLDLQFGNEILGADVGIWVLSLLLLRHDVYQTATFAYVLLLYSVFGIGYFYLEGH